MPSLVYIQTTVGHDYNTPAAYSDVAANTTAIPCAIGVHALAVLSDCLSRCHFLKLTLELAV